MQFLSSLLFGAMIAVSATLAHQTLPPVGVSVATNQTNLPIEQWLQNNVSAKQYRFLIGDGDGYLVKNKKQLDALFDLYFAIAGLKNDLANQLEQQVKGVEQSIGDKQGGEGFVFNTPKGLVKLVNRGGFSTAHFGKKK